MAPQNKFSQKIAQEMFQIITETSEALTDKGTKNLKVDQICLLKACNEIIKKVNKK